MGQVAKKKRAESTENLTFPKGNATLGQVVGSHFNLDLVTRQNTNVVFAHFARDMGNDNVIIFQLYPESGIRQSVDNLAFKFNVIFFRHKPDY